MLATNRQGQVGIDLAPARGTDVQKLAHAIHIQRMERVLGEHALLDIGPHEPPRVIARQAIGHLGQIVRPKGQERRMLGDITGAQGRARGFHHHTQTEIEIRAGLGFDPRRNRVDAGFNQFDLALGTDQRDHDLGHNGGTALARLDRRLENRARLHLVNLGDRDPQAHAAHPQHRVEFRQSLNPAGHVRNGFVQRLGQLAHALAVMGQEFVQGRVEQTDAHRRSRHDFKQAGEIAPLHRQELIQRRRAVLGSVGKNHFAHHRQAVVLKEHVLGPAETNPVRPEIPRNPRIRRRVGIGAHTHIANILGPGQQRTKRIVQRRAQHLGLARNRDPFGAVDRDDVALGKGAPVLGAQHSRARIQRDLGHAHNARHPKAARDHRRVAGDAAAFGQDRAGRVHAANVLGRGFAPHKDTGLIARRSRLCRAGTEHDPTHRRTGAGRNPMGKHIVATGLVHLTVQQFVQGARFDPAHGLFARDDPRIGQGHGNAHRRAGRARHADRVQHV